MHPGEEPFDPGVINPDPRVNIGLIHGWLKEEIDKLQVLVAYLDIQSKQDPTGDGPPFGMWGTAPRKSLSDGPGVFEPHPAESPPLA